MAYVKRVWFLVVIILALASTLSPPSLAGELIDALKLRNMVQVRSLLAAGESVNKQVRGDYPLNVAAVYGPAEMVSLLLEAGAGVEQPGRDGYRPLHNAVFMGHREIVALLIQKGAIIEAKDRKGRTPLNYFAASGGSDIEIAKMLLAAGAHPGTEDLDRETALGSAAATGNLELGKLLIAAHADVNHQPSSGESPVHAAAFHRRYEFVKLLIDAGANVNLRSKTGYTPLFYVSDAAIRRLLIEAGAK